MVSITDNLLFTISITITITSYIVYYYYYYYYYLFIYLSYSKYSNFVDNQQTTKNIAKREQSTVPNVQTKRVSNILTYDIILVNISSSLQHQINNSCYT